MSAMAGAAEDRGWNWLSPDAHLLFDDDQRRYAREASAVDWQRVAWDIENSYDNDGTWVIEVAVDGGWESVPSFMRDSRLATIYCQDHRAAGFVVLMILEDDQAAIQPVVRPGTAERGECA